VLTLQSLGRHGREGSRVILPLKHRKPRGHRVTLTRGMGAIIHPDGYREWIDSEWQYNAMANEGQTIVLNTVFLGVAMTSLYLALLTATPTKTTTEATMTEVFTPPLNGYARVQVNTGDWGAPALDSGDEMTTAAQKTFGPASSNAWNSLTYVAMVTTSTGTAGKFFCFIALSGTTTIAIGQSFDYTISQKCQ
jgi:hypothetical protein